jgi:hypothetical protein
VAKLAFNMKNSFFVFTLSSRPTWRSKGTPEMPALVFAGVLAGAPQLYVRNHYHHAKRLPCLFRAQAIAQHD